MQFQNMTDTNISKIIGIQFSILSPDEIRKTSVAHITSRDTYVNNKPVINGLFDPRMGVLEPGLICPTDGLTYMQTPGYFGHLELARPVFYIQYLNHINKILRCVCIKCSKLLISKTKYKEAMDMNNKDRWDYVFEHASKIKRCGEDNEDGCGCRQPDKIRKDGLASLYAEWTEIQEIDSDDKDKLIMKMTPEIVLKIFKRISDDDVDFMGFSSVFSRPDWMVCQVLAVPPPAVRPSVKHDAQQRSEDDLSHIIVNIIKANKTLQDKIEQNAKENVVEDWTNVLQYYVAMMVNNNIPGVASVAQRSGRPLKSIIERLNGKGGRVRGNLMGKRVDFSARSVITADPNLSIRELGVPIKIAMNITYPVKVTERNINTLKYMVVNGPDKYPGAKVLEKKNGESISLRYVDRLNINLSVGDTVHRHMLDGDPVLFNRQPTLHRMSMMCHLAKIMKEGNTFRMNVADTKPYNADFDGDEMNMHMPQDDESRAELLNLAAVPRQIISPANNSSIVGIFQDSLLGCYRFTRAGIQFTPEQAMNLMMKIKDVDLSIFSKKQHLDNFTLLSQILPPLYARFKNNSYDGDEDDTMTNNIVEIVNGVMKRGQLDKNVKKLIHTIFNDFGFNASSDFIDNLQNIITEYMKMSAFSVGISDLIADRETNNKISNAIVEKKKDVNKLIEQVQIGVFENNTGKSNYEEFETSVNSILNKAMEEAGKIGRKSLSTNNRFKIMVDAGSKGSHLNIAQMISCLGQQNVDGKRIPYGFEDRTLPHYTKYNDSPEARGFVESSFIQGLTPQELFFHAMGGRVGLIDTAVKSVAWETPVLVFQDGSVTYIEIGKWIDGTLDTYEELIQYQEKDNMELLDISGAMISTTDMSGNVCWAEVTAMTRHDPGDKLFKIITKSGRDVIVTASKSLIVWNEETNQFKEKYTEEISVGDFLPTTLSLKNNLELEHIPTYLVLEQFHKDRRLVPNMLLLDHYDIVNIVNKMISLFSVETEDYLFVVFDTKEQVDLFSQLCSRVGIFGEFSGYSYHIPKSHSYSYRNDVVLDPIVRIEEVDVKKHPKMYDLTIPKTLNFGLANGLQVRDTSQTGYIQRRLIKGMEDLKVEYDMTVRNNMGKLVQFTYGDDNIDTTKVESQSIPLSKMTVSDIYNHFDIPKNMKNKNLLYKNYFIASIISQVKNDDRVMSKHTTDLIHEMIQHREDLIHHVFKEEMDDKVNIPVNFQRIIQNIKHQLHITENSLVDITPLHCYHLIQDFKTQLNRIHMAKPTRLFYILFDYYINPIQMIYKHRFHKDAMLLLLTTILHNYKKALVAPGEMVGMLSAQSIGEPTTQMSCVYDERMRIIKVSKEGIECITPRIGEFIDEYITQHPTMTFNTGHPDSVETCLDMDDYEYYIVGVDEREKTSWNKISHVSRHPVNGELIMVKTASGRETITTKSHSHLIRNKDRQCVVPIQGSDLKVGMRIPVLKHISNDKTHMTTTWDVYSLDESFGFFVGAYLACGRTEKKNIQIIHENPVYLERCIEFSNKYDIDFTMVEGTTLILHSTSLSTLLDNACYDYYLKVPSVTYTAPHSFISGLVQGYMDGNSTFECSPFDEYVSVSSSERMLLMDLSILMNYFGIFTLLDVEDCMYHLIVPNTYSMKYSSKIGSLLHQEKLIEYIHPKACRFSMDRIYGLDTILTRCCRQLDVEDCDDVDKYGSISRDTIQEYITQFDKHDNVDKIQYEMSILKQACFSDVVWDEIVEINNYTNYEHKYVYDFTVPHNQTFMTGDGILVHNTLNTFHLAGVSSKSNVTRGVPRIEEILSLSKEPKNPSVTIHLKESERLDRLKAQKLMYLVEHTSLRDVVVSSEICFDPDNMNTLIQQDKELMTQYHDFQELVSDCIEREEDGTAKSKWVLRFEFNKELLLDKNITMDDIHFAIENGYPQDIECIYTDYNSDNLVFRIRLKEAISKKKGLLKSSQLSLDQSDEIYMLKNIQDNLMDSIVLKGIPKISKVNIRKIQNIAIFKDGDYHTDEIWVLDTVGSNLLDILSMNEFNVNETYSNNIMEMYDVLGIEAARQSIFNEFQEVIQFDGTYINFHHLALLCDRMCYSHKPISIFRHGINNDDIGPIAKASFEETPEMFLRAARHGELDNLRGVSANVMCGQLGNFGTSSFQVVLDMNRVKQMKRKEVVKEDTVDELFKLENVEDPCSIQNIKIVSNVKTIQGKNRGEDNDYSPGF